MSRAGVRRHVLDQQGMTVAEILIAVVIIGMGLVALSSVIPLSAYGIQEGNQLSTATFLANQRLEQARNAQWTAAQPLMTPPTAAVDKLGVSASSSAAPVGDGGAITFPDENPVAAPYDNYSRQVRITDCGAAPGCSGITDPALRQVTVTVRYRPMTGFGMAPATRAKSAVVTIYIAQR